MIYIFIGMFLFVVILACHQIRQSRREKILDQLRESWGKISDEQSDVLTARILFDKKQDEVLDNGYIIDERTWQDLDMDEFFVRMDRTDTAAGTQCLYNLLRTPCLTRKNLEYRDHIIDHMGKNQILREKLQNILLSAQYQNCANLPILFWGNPPEETELIKKVPYLAITSLFILLLVILGYLPWPLLLFLFAINFLIDRYYKVRLDSFSLRAIASMLHVATAIAKLKEPVISEVCDSLKSSLKKLSALKKILSPLTIDDLSGLYQYVQAIFLLDALAYYSLLQGIKYKKKDLCVIYENIGFVDALISIASVREQFEKHCQPELKDDRNNFKVVDIYHPLLENPVWNSFQFLKRGNLITGSNMSGKTTFLKTMGINAILAQTFFFVFAKNYQAPFLKVLSSIGRADNLIEGKSYYFIEVESILRLLHAMESGESCLFLIDEVFRGTNSIERIAASSEVLRYLTRGISFILAATHDLELTDLLNEVIDNYHFSEKVDACGLSFDYTLKPGISSERNAISLLEYAGYPKEVVQRAKNEVQALICNVKKDSNF